MIKLQKTYFCALLALCLLANPSVKAQEQIRQTLSIYTNFTSIVGDPSWMIELRDIESGQVFPYIFDIHENRNFWLAFSKERSYRVVASVLTFGPYLTINNFCGLESGILTGKSMYIRVSGMIAPDLRRTRCHVVKFKQEGFAIANPEQ